VQPVDREGLDGLDKQHAEHRNDQHAQSGVGQRKARRECVRRESPQPFSRTPTPPGGGWCRRR
jgi:hypothetical protein